MTRWVSAVFTAFFFCFCSAAFAADPTRAAVIDAQTSRLVVVDLATGGAVGRVELADAPTDLLVTPDGTRLLVLSRGAGSETFWSASFRPKTKSSLTVIAAKTLEILARTELGWSLADATLMNDGTTLAVLSPGVSGKPAETKPAELFTVDARSGEISGRHALDRPADGFAVAPDQKTGIVYFEGAPRAKRPTETLFIDLATMKEAGRVSLDARTNKPVIVEGSDHVYLLDPPLMRPGTLYVLSVPERKLAATLQVGRSASVAGIVPATNRLLVMSEVPSADKKNYGELKVLAGAEVAASVPVPRVADRIHFTPDGREAYMVAGNRVGSVRLADMTVQSAMETQGYSREIAFTHDGRRAVVYDRGDDFCCRMNVFDLESRQRLTSFMTGSKGLRIAQLVVAAAATASSYEAGKSQAQSKGRSSFYYTIYTPGPGKAARGPLAVSRDGKFAYALDTQTGYVTIAELGGGERIGNISIPMNGKELVLLPDGRLLAAVTDESVVMIDTSSNEKVDEVKLAGEIRDFVVSPAGDRAIIMSKERLIVYDTEKRRSLAEIGGLKRPVDLVFLD
jgi:DNA-binding beta-propeller fold protein YncE